MTRKWSRFLPGVKRSRFLSPSKAIVPVGTRSVVRSSAYGPGYYSRRSYDDDVLYAPYRPYHHHTYDTSGNENYTRSQVNKELLMSSAAMDDNYDISNRSRNRDREVIAAASRAIMPKTIVSTFETKPLSTLGASDTRRKPSLRRARSYSVPKQPTYTTTTTLLPLDLVASPAPKPSPYLQYANSLKTTSSLKDGSYNPMYSRAVRTPYSPIRDMSPYRTDSPYRSPSRSGTQTPIENGSMRNTRFGKKRYKPRVLSTKRRLGNYYNRLLSRRATDGSSREGKYWPYLNVEDIDSENVGDLFSDTESVGNAGGSGETYIIKSTEPTDYDDDDTNVKYVYDYSDSDIPNEYVPFRPKVRHVSPERDYSELSVIPFLPKRDPGNSVSDDIAFNAVVASSAARARQALERVKWDDYDSAGLVLSVEGEYHPPQSDVPVGFRYVSRPLALKTPASARVSAYDSDNVFTKYMTDLQKFREGIRARLEDGYKALSTETKSYYTPALPSPSYKPATSTSTSISRPILKPYHKRLRDDDEYKYGHSLELYPLSSSSRAVAGSSVGARPRSSDSLPESRAIKLYDSNLGPDSSMSTLQKIQIKVDTELHTSPRSAVAASRVMRGQSTPPPSHRTSSLSHREAALLGSKVDVVLPERRHRTPRSSYAQAKVRQIHLAKGRESESPVVATETSSLRAHKPVSASSYSKPIHDVDGVKKPNLLSWKYRLYAITSPDDLIIVPRSISTVKKQLRDAQDKMDKHRQLMDRYLDTDTGLTSEDQKVLMSIKSRDPVAAPALPDEAKPSDRVKKRRQKLLRKHRMEY